MRRGMTRLALAMPFAFFDCGGADGNHRHNEFSRAERMRDEMAPQTLRLVLRPQAENHLVGSSRVAGRPQIGDCFFDRLHAGQVRRRGGGIVVAAGVARIDIHDRPGKPRSIGQRRGGRRGRRGGGGAWPLPMRCRG